MANHKTVVTATLDEVRNKLTTYLANQNTIRKLGAANQAILGELRTTLDLDPAGDCTYSIDDGPPLTPAEIRRLAES